MDVLDEIVTKLDRAKEHLETFDNEVRAYIEGNSYRFSSEFQRKGENRYDWVFTIHVLRDPPLRLSAIFGDGLYNVRSALDHLTWQLAVKNVGLNGDLDGTEFPIFKHKGRYMAKNGKDIPLRTSGLYKVRSIHTDAQAIIESLQPYHGGDNLILWHLHELSNIDKHRRFHLVSPVLGDSWIAGRPLGEGLTPGLPRDFIIHGVTIAKPPFKDGAEVARYDIAVPPGFDFKVRVQHNIPGEVILDEFGQTNVYAAPILAGLIGFVRRKVLPSLQKFL